MGQKVAYGCGTLISYVILAAFLIILVLPALALYGVAVALIGAALAYSSPGFRVWLSSKRGYKARLSRLPGLGSSSPLVLGFSILIYIIPLAVISWFSLALAFQSAGSVLTWGVMGLGGLLLLYAWFIHGWRLESDEDEIYPSPQFSLGESASFLKQNKAAAGILVLGLIIPFICGGLGLSLANVELEPTAIASESLQTTRALPTADELEIYPSASTISPTATEKPPSTNAAATSLPTVTTIGMQTLQPSTTFTRQPTVTMEPEVEVNIGSANVRSGPGTNYDTITMVGEGSRFVVIAKNSSGDWYNVLLDDGTLAWIAASVVDEVSSLVRVEVAQTIPAPPTVVATSPLLPTNTSTPLPTNTLAPLPTNTLPPPTLPPPTQSPPTEPPPPSNCDPSYPTVCIPPPPPDLDCGEIPFRRFTVLPPDPHGFDRDNDGIGCES